MQVLLNHNLVVWITIKKKEGTVAVFCNGAFFIACLYFLQKKRYN